MNAQARGRRLTAITRLPKRTIIILSDYIFKVMGYKIKVVWSWINNILLQGQGHTGLDQFSFSSAFELSPQAEIIKWVMMQHPYEQA